MLREYVHRNKIGDTDQLFPIRHAQVNRYLHRLAKRVLGHDRTLAGSRYSDLTMYDFRHSSACYWLQRYKSESALMYRFGWKRSKMIYYYTELLGMRDIITQDDLLIDGTKTKIEKSLTKAKTENRVLEEELRAMREKMQHILTVVADLSQRVAGKLEDAEHNRLNATSIGG